MPEQGQRPNGLTGYRSILVASIGVLGGLAGAGSGFTIWTGEFDARSVVINTANIHSIEQDIADIREWQFVDLESTLLGYQTEQNKLHKLLNDLEKELNAVDRSYLEDVTLLRSTTKYMREVQIDLRKQIIEMRGIVRDELIPLLSPPGERMQ